ncbi:uncharacterized protein LOC131857627 [Cryptomeria japonica]|uniref:uncharacterized protein LOC131857627 n=1 Tax=Cryptomeria japonica TaxID=3369 RepID=UPI0027DAA95E|nr:uncharacterized protein LOC131857627 [Cryptomeria japonica]
MEEASGQVPGSTGNEVKNYWNMYTCKKLSTKSCSPGVLGGGGDMKKVEERNGHGGGEGGRQRLKVMGSAEGVGGPCGTPAVHCGFPQWRLSSPVGFHIGGHCRWGLPVVASLIPPTADDLERAMARSLWWPQGERRPLP